MLLNSLDLRGRRRCPRSYWPAPYCPEFEKSALGGGYGAASGFMADHRPGAVISCFQNRGYCCHPGDGLFRLFVPGSDGCMKIACVRYRFVFFLCGSISCHPLKLSYLGSFVESVF